MADRDGQRREDHLREVDRVLLYVAEARLKAAEIAATLESEQADERFVVAVREAAEAMEAEHKRLMNATFYSVPANRDLGDLDRPPSGQERMAV